MSNMSENYKKILSQIEEKVSNPEEKEFVKNKISELVMMFIDMFDNLSDMVDTKINDLEERQKELKLKMDKVESTVNGIEDDIYLDEAYDFEIVCPYCNNEFVAEFDSENHPKEEIECPECHNIIELDWNDEDDEFEGCTGSCSSCHGCEEDIIQEYEDKKDIDDNKETEKDDNDDDM